MGVEAERERRSGSNALARRSHLGCDHSFALARIRRARPDRIWISRSKVAPVMSWRGLLFFGFSKYKQGTRIDTSGAPRFI